MANYLITGARNNTPHVTSMDDASFNAGIVGNGAYILNRGEKLRAEMTTANNCRIYDGDLVAQGRHTRIETSEYIDLTVNNGTSGMKRNDLVVARYVNDAETGVESVDFVVIEGTASANPVDPSYNEGDIFDGDLIVDFPLYRIQLDGITAGTPELICEMSNGIGADSIIEYGTRYTKWASGKCECWGSSTLASGSNSRTVSASLPISMVGNYFVNLAAYLNGSIVDKMWCGSIGGNNTKASGKFDISAITSNADYDVGVDWTVVGRWK